MADIFRAQAFLPFGVRSSIRPFTTRVEPNPISGDPAVGLMAEVWDPLWMLARQWQLGEFAGEDTGTPLTVAVTAELDPLVAWHPGAVGPDAEWIPLPAGTLLEPLVESEHPEEEGSGTVVSARAAAAAAWALQQTLSDLGEKAAVAALIEHCPPAAAAEPVDPRVGESDWAGVSGVLAGRSFDALAVAREFEAGHPSWFTDAVRTGAARRRRAAAAVDEWLEWFDEELRPPATPGSWHGDRLEYEFAVATTRAVLHAPQYTGGEVGWSTFDHEPSLPPPGAGDRAPVPIERHVLASQLTFPGMPASRFWEFEDADIDLGAVYADPHELARVLVVEAAIVTGDDWLVLPVDTPPGGVLRITGVQWVDTFGALWLADERASVVPAGRSAPPWTLFATSAPHPEAGSPRDLPGLFIPPTAASRLEGAVVEDVRFLRDETANLVWAIEQTAPADSGDGRAVVAPPAEPAPAIAPGAEPPDQVLGYALQTFVPDNWHPYVARLHEKGVVLQRGVVDRGGAPARPEGVLLNEEAQRIVLAGEVPRQGVRVQRVPTAARQADGSWVLWTARRVRPGTGEGESGLTFDATRRPKPPA